MNTDPRSSGTCRRPVAGVLLALALLCGCGGPDGAAKKKASLSAEDEQQAQAMLTALRSQVEVQRDMLAVLKSVTDQSSMPRALDELLRLNDRAEAAKRAEIQAGVLSADAQLFVQEQPVLEELSKLREQWTQETRRITNLPGGPAFFESLSRELKKLKAP